MTALRNLTLCLVLLSGFTLVACGPEPAGPASSGPAAGTVEHIRAVSGSVDGDMIRANETSSRDWPSHGLDYAETRFSRLTQINDANVSTE